MSKNPLLRLLYLCHLSKINLPKDQVLKLVQQSYGMPESRVHWYTNHFGVNMSTVNTKFDPCFVGGE